MAEEMSDQVPLRNEATQAFIAAHETTASLISKAVYLVARYPPVWAVAGRALSIGNIPRKMKYLRHVINKG